MNDYELIYMAQEQNEDAINIIYEKYTNLINILIAKKIRMIKYLNIDIQEMYNECLNGLSDAITGYNNDCNALFVTYAATIINNRINNIITHKNTNKEKFKTKVISLESNIIISKELQTKKADPLTIITKKENYNHLAEKLKTTLSDFEKKVYTLLLDGLNYHEIAKILNKKDKQIDNAIQRIKNKLKKLEISYHL